MKIQFGRAANLCSLLLIAAFHLNAQTSSLFREKYIGNTASTSHIYGMSFVTPATGYVAFANGIGFTQDSGHTYIKKPVSVANTNFNGYTVNLTFGFTPRGVHMFSQDSLLAYGDFGAEPSILFSADGGNNWKLVFHQPLNLDPDINNSIFDMKFPAGGSGVAITQKFIVESTDRGQTWAVTYQIDPFYAGSRFTKLSTPTPSEFYVAAGNYLFKRQYGYTIGVAVPPSQGLNYNTVSFVTLNTGYISRDDNGAVYKTINGGDSWTPLNDTINNPVYARDLYFVNDSIGFAASGTDYNVLRTINNGVTWETCKKNSNYQVGFYGMNRLFFLNDQVGWASGRGEYLMLTTSGGNPTIPKASFVIDAPSLTSASPVYLTSYSNPLYQYKWYKNGILISTAVNASYLHDITVLSDTIKLVVSNGTDSDSLVKYQGFIYPLPPNIVSFTPASAGPNGTITIAGNGFVRTSSVTFGGLAAASFTVNSNNIITAVIGGGLPGDIVVTTPNGKATASGFAFVLQGKPVISAFTPESGPIKTLVTITGSNFNSVLSQNIVHFGKVAAKILSASSGQLICEVPAGASFEPISIVNLSSRLRGASAKPFAVTFGGNNTIETTSFNRVTTLIPPPFDTHLFYPWSMAIGDIDGDGKNDIASVIRYETIGDSIFICRNRSAINNITFDQKVWIANGSYVTLGDIDSDGKLDMLFRSSPGMIGISINSSTAGSISFKPPVHFPGINDKRNLIIGDVDSDGRPDILMVGHNDGNLGILQNISFGNTISFAPMMIIPTGEHANALALGDLDGDGKNDVIVSANPWSNPGNEVIHVYRNTGSPGIITFSPVIDLPSATTVWKTFIADVDNDDKPDIVVSNSPQSSSGRDFSLYRNTSTPGNFSFQPNDDFISNEFPITGEINNISGDSLVDYISGNYNSSTFYLFKNSSTQGAGVGFDLAGPFGTSAYFETTICSADLDGDGKPEITCTEFKGIEIFRNRIGEPVLYVQCPGVSPINITSNIPGSSYQWQLDSGSGYANITDNATYTNATGSMLSIANAPTSWYGYKYRCLADGKYSNEYILTFQTSRRGPVDDIWENYYNWNCFILPDANTDVIVPYGNLIINSNVTIRSLKLEPGSTITVNAPFKLIVAH